MLSYDFPRVFKKTNFHIVCFIFQVVVVQVNSLITSHVLRKYIFLLSVFLEYFMRSALPFYAFLVETYVFY